MGLLKYAINYGLYFFSKSPEQVRHDPAAPAAQFVSYSQMLLGRSWACKKLATAQEPFLLQFHAHVLGYVQLAS